MHAIIRAQSEFNNAVFCVFSSYCRTCAQIVVHMNRIQYISFMNPGCERTAAADAIEFETLKGENSVAQGADG